MRRAFTQPIDPPEDILASMLAERTACATPRLGWTTRCLSEDQVLQFVAGSLASPAVRQIDAHLNVCHPCSNLVVEAARQSQETTSSPRPTSPTSPRCWTLCPGARIADRYVILRQLGHGGMGDVYEAHDQLGDTLVALKTSRAESCDQPDEHRRLLSEFILARRVRHPNVCRVHHAGTHRATGRYREEFGFFSMDLIEGQCLSQKLRAEKLTPAQACRVTLGLLDGLAAIHRSGVIHRDIKSRNVMLRHGDPSLLTIIDFGLAVDRNERPRGVPARCERHGSVSFDGSPGYMAPEQFQGGNVTPATDIFACGVVLFESLTGTLPFHSLHMNRHGALRDPTEIPLRLTEIVPTIPGALQAFVAGCLELDPSRRYPSAEAAASALELAMPGE